MAPREKQTLTGDRVITGRLTVYGGVNSPDVVKNITDVATTKEQVTQLETTVQEIADEPFGPAIRSSAPAIVIKADGTVVPEEITFQGVVKPLNGDPSFYLGIFKIYKDGDLYYTTPTAVTSLTWTVDIVQSLTPGPEVYPAINLYPSFSNRLITIELYDDTGTTLKDSMNISILPSWESYIQNELSGYTPKYIGKFNAAHPSSYHNGDWWLVYDTDDTPITRGVYRAINYTPTLVDGSDAANSQFMVAALPDILWASNNSYGDLEDYAPITYISNLVANAAFISNLFAQYIKIQTGGSIRGGDRYDEDGAVVDGTKPGFFIGANGACKVAGIEFEGSQGGGVAWSGISQIGSSYSISGVVDGSGCCYFGPTMLVFADEGNNNMRMLKWNGSTWAMVGSALSLTDITYPRMCKLNDTDIVLVQASSTIMRVFRWNGSSFSQVGSTYNFIGGTGVTSVCSIDSTHVVTHSSGSYGATGGLRVFEWNGSTFSLVCSNLDIYGGVNPYYSGIAALSNTDVAVLSHTKKQIATFRFNGSSISQIGNALDLGDVSVPQLTAINSSEVVALLYPDMIVLRWDGENWSIIEECTMTFTLPTTPCIAAMSGNTFAFFFGGSLKMYSIQFCLSYPWRYPFDS